MRMIDADKVDFNEVFGGKSDFARDTREAAESLIDIQPTVNMPVQPVVNKYYYFCPSCGTRRSIRQKHNYCHDCGQEFKWEN